MVDMTGLQPPGAPEKGQEPCQRVPIGVPTRCPGMGQRGAWPPTVHGDRRGGWPGTQPGCREDRAAEARAW